MRRRDFLLGTAALPLAACQPADPPATATPATIPAAGDPLRLVYVSADDCSWCAQWEREQAPGFSASPERQRVQFEQVKVESVYTARFRRAWPAPARPVHDQLTVHNVRFNLPIFVLMRGPSMLVGASGAITGWAAVHQALLTELARG